MRGTRVAVAVGVAFGCAAAHADPAPPAVPAMSLREALVYAHQHQPSLAAARARVAVARAVAEVPRAAFSPRVAGAAEILLGTSNNTTASYASIGILDVARVGGSPANAPASWEPDASTLVGVGVHQEIFDFGRYEAQADALDAQTTAATADAVTAVLDLDLLVENAFYSVQGAKAILSAARAAVQRSQSHHDLADARVRAQLWSPILLTRADADLARYTVERVRAEGSLATAQNILAATIGASEPAIDAGADDVAFPQPPSVDSAERGLDKQSPELLSARAHLVAQQKTTTAIRAELRPDLSASAELTGRAGGATVSANPTPTGDGLLPDVQNWDALVVFSWPIFDRTVTARATASERVEAVRSAELDEVTQQLRATVARTFVELQVAQAAVPALQRALDAANANHAQAEAQFTAGLGTAVELSDAEALLTDAQIQLAVGQFQQSRARARLGRAISEATP
jgi:outer membrane protein TolC